CPLPSYFDPNYGCEMELLRFDSNAPNPKYQARIDDILSRFFELPVVCARRAAGVTSAAKRPAFVPLRLLREACAQRKPPPRRTGGETRPRHPTTHADT